MLKKLIRTSQHLTQEQILAIILLLLIFFIASATLPATVINLGNLAWLYDVKNRINDEYLSMLTFQGDFLRNKSTYINFHGLLARLLGQRFMNDAVLLDNGHLAYLIKKADIIPTANYFVQLSHRQQADGKAFLLVLAPAQISKYEDLLPPGFVDYSNYHGDELLSVLQANGVPFLDLRLEANKEGFSHADMFFKTDHHWRPETGFWAYTKIIAYLVQAGIIEEVEPKYTDLNEFNIEVYQDWWLGSAGKRTGVYFAGVDDFSVISPKFATADMSIKIATASVEVKGNFAEVLYNASANRRDYFLASPYEGYGHNDWDNISHRNGAAPVDKKILTIGDSFGNVVFPYLDLIFSNQEELDMRRFSENFEEYYQKYNPDLVIVLVHTGDLIQPDGVYNFFDDVE